MILIISDYTYMYVPGAYYCIIDATLVVHVLYTDRPTY